MDVKKRIFVFLKVDVKGTLIHLDSVPKMQRNTNVFNMMIKNFKEKIGGLDVRIIVP